MTPSALIPHPPTPIATHYTSTPVHRGDLSETPTGQNHFPSHPAIVNELCKCSLNDWY